MREIYVITTLLTIILFFINIHEIKKINDYYEKLMKINEESNKRVDWYEAFQENERKRAKIIKKIEKEMKKGL